MTHWSIDNGTDEPMKIEILDFVDHYSRMVETPWLSRWQQQPT